MNLYPLLLFAHILGAIGMFVAASLEWIALLRIRGADNVADARRSASLLSIPPRVGPISAGTILVSGIILGAMRGGIQGWMAVSLATMVLIAVLAALNGRRLGMTLAGLPQSGALTGGDGPRNGAHLVSISARSGMLLAIVFLMTVKPDLVGSIVAVAVAGVVGALAAMVRARRPTGDALTHGA